MNSRDPITKALGKLDWIAKLSKESLPGGAPRDFESTHTLLNRIVLDVWAASKLMKETQEQGKSDRSDKSDRSEQQKKCPGLIPTHGGYRNLKSFQVIEEAYDGMMIFLKRFVEKHSRTHDQMVQAARSSRLNIEEGSVVSATSKKIELKLTNVAKASLEELLLDFKDFLQQRRLCQWDKNDLDALALRRRYR